MRMALSRDSRDSGVARWSASFASTLTPVSPSRAARVGTLILRREAARLVLLDEEEVVIDARCLREGERVAIGVPLELPAHRVTPLAHAASSAMRSSGTALAEKVRQVPPRPTEQGILGPIPRVVEVNGGPISPPATVPDPHGTEVGVGKVSDASRPDLHSLFAHFGTR